MAKERVYKSRVMPHNNMKRPQGRPPATKSRGSSYKLDEPIVKRFMEAKEKGATNLIAAGAAGLSHNCVVRWMRRGREEEARRDAILEHDPTATFPDDVETPYLYFYRRFHEAVAKHALAHLGVLDEAGKSGDTKSSQWILERVHGYGATATTRLVGSGRDGAVAIENIEPLKPTQLADILTLADESED